MTFYEYVGQIVTYLVLGIADPFVAYFLLCLVMGTLHFLFNRFFEGQELVAKSINKLIRKSKGQA